MLGVIVAAIMAASFFLPWVDIFGNSIGPTMLFSENAPALSDFPWQGWAFLASFAIAALAAVVALAGRPAGVLMLIAGAIPFGLIAQQVVGAKGQMDDLGLPIPQGGDPSETWDVMREFIQIGAPAYFICAALLVLIGLARTVRGR